MSVSLWTGVVILLAMMNVITMAMSRTIPTIIAVCLNSLETSSVQEMREFIKKGLEEWEAFNSVRADPNDPELVENTDANMEYRIEMKNYVFGSSLVETAYLHLISLSDSIEVARLLVNRGNCRADYRDGANPITYGNSMRFFLDCDPRNIREVTVILKDGRQIVMTPK